MIHCGGCNLLARKEEENEAEGAELWLFHTGLIEWGYRAAKVCISSIKYY